MWLSPTFTLLALFVPRRATMPALDGDDSAVYLRRVVIFVFVLYWWVAVGLGTYWNDQLGMRLQLADENTGLRRDLTWFPVSCCVPGVGCALTALIPTCDLMRKFLSCPSAISQKRGRRAADLTQEREHGHKAGTAVADRAQNRRPHNTSTLG